MISQNLIRTENFVALQALVQLFPNVYHLVLLQVPSLIEPFVEFHLLISTGCGEKIEILSLWA